jgi:hypothetical protein
LGKFGWNNGDERREILRWLLWDNHKLTLYFPDEFGVKWDSEFPNIAKWLARISALKGWKHPYQMLPGHPLPGNK